MLVSVPHARADGKATQLAEARDGIAHFRHLGHAGDALTRRRRGFLYGGIELTARRQARGGHHAVLRERLAVALLVPHVAGVLPGVVAPPRVVEGVFTPSRALLHLCDFCFHDGALVWRQLCEHGLELAVLAA